MKSSRVLGLETNRVSQLHHHPGTFDISQRIASIGNLFNQHNKKRHIFKFLSRFFFNFALARVVFSSSFPDPTRTKGRRQDMLSSRS